MKKRKIAVLIGLFACALLALGLAACQPEHQHTFSEEWAFDATHHWHEATCEHSEETEGKAEHTWDGGTVTTAATCTEAGEKTYTCTVCSATKTEAIAATGHSYAEEWTIIPTHHWRVANCEHGDMITDYGTHTYVNGDCILCGYTYVSLGLQYTLSDDGTYYTLTGTGTNTDTDVVVPAEHEGLPVKAIGDNALEGNTAITSIILQDGIERIGEGAFKNCTALISIHIPDSVQSMAGYTFRGCSALESIELPAMTDIDTLRMFESCTSLKSVVLGEGVESLGYYMFSACRSLERVELPSSLRRIRMLAFQTCGALTEITLPEGLVEIGDSAFRGCQGLKEVVIPDSVTLLDDESFLFCTTMTKVVVGEGVESIGREAFMQCIKLEEIIIGSSVKSIATEAFYLCRELKTVYYMGTQEEWNTIGVDNTNNYNSSLLNATRYYYSETQPSTECYSWYYAEDGITPVAVEAHTIAEEWTTTDTHHWHETCEHKTSENGYGEHTYENGVCTVCGMEYVSAGLEYSLHSDETCYVVTGRGTNLDTELVIPATHEGLPVKRIGDRAFKDTNITNVVLPNSITFIGSFAFSDCSELVSINLPEGLQSIAFAAFQSTALKNIIIPASLSILEVGAFERCFDLESVRFANGSFISTIETNTFNSDASLQSVIIPAGVNLIQSGAFGNCYALQSVYYVGTQDEWNGIIIDDSNESLTSATIYYYSETQPADTSGNWWHYGTDGVTPVKW